MRDKKQIRQFLFLFFLRGKFDIKLGVNLFRCIILSMKNYGTNSKHSQQPRNRNYLPKNNSHLSSSYYASSSRFQRETEEKKEEERSSEEQSRMISVMSSMLNLSPAEVKNLLKGESHSKPQPHKNQNFNKYKDRPKHTSEKYISSLKNIENDKFGILSKIKTLKKSILNAFKTIDNVTVSYSTKYPMLIFSYNENKNKGDLKYKHLREIMKEVSNLRQKRDLLDDIFGRIYSRVDPKFKGLVVFALEKAEEIHLRLTRKELMNESQDHSIMFFFQKSDKEINFIIFDQLMRSIEFDSEFIQRSRTKYPEQFSKFRQFYESTFQERDQTQTNDILDREEVESDQERSEIEEKPLTHVKIELQKIMGKNLSELEDKIQLLEQQIQEEALIDNSSDKMLRLADELVELQENKTNFENVRNKVKASILRGGKESYFSGLKKMLIAEKQLQSKLPIVAKKRQIFEKLKKQPLLIIEGETGSGKSTQLPQILAEYYELFDNPHAKPVLVTQPRRLATRSLAERVAKEMGQNLGGFVDYVASAGKQARHTAKIIFKLDRLVLDQITEDQLLSKYSCLVIDEAHERTISIDVIIGLVKGLLKKRKDFKVIVTSASMDIQLFENYFNTKTLRVSGRMFPVAIAYKDYAQIKEGDRWHVVRKIEKVIDEEILHDQNSMKVQFKGHVLCFCSGVEEISELVRRFEKKLNHHVFSVLPLHGKISPADQQKVFEASGKHKIIFASRIAETAITIDGVRVVIDPGQDIELIYDQKYKISTMKLVEISQSSAKQRAGRSGRTGPGHCFRLYSQLNFKKRKVCKVPEMQNSSLETVVLRLKSLKINDVVNFPYISRPSTEGLQNSVQLLTLIGALQGKTQEITKIGGLLIRIPVDPFLSRAIVEGMIFERIMMSEQCAQLLSEFPQQEIAYFSEKGLVHTITVTLSLLINFSNLFFIQANDREKGESVKFSEFSDQDGDFFFLNNIYEKYVAFKKSSKLNVSKLFQNAKNHEMREWLKKNYLNIKAFSQAQELVNEITKITETFQINQDLFEKEVQKTSLKIKKCKSFREMVLSCLVTSFSPNLCKYSGNPHIGYTLVNQRRPVQIYGTSNLSLLGIQADWIICYDLYTNEMGRLYCKAAHKVSYEFIKDHTDPYIQQRFQIHKIQQSNPFYQQLHYSLPTAVISQIKAQFSRSSRDQQLYFLQSTFPIIEQQKNEVTFFIMVQQQVHPKLLQNLQILMTTEELIQTVQIYVQTKLYEINYPFKHNYMGNIYVYLQDGFQINSIQTDRREFSIEIISIDRMAAYILEVCSQFGKRQVYPIEAGDKILNKFYQFKYQNVFKKAIFCELDQTQKYQLAEWLEALKKSNPQVPLEYTVKMMDHRNKIPQGKIYLHFFAGKNFSQKNNLFMSYKIFKQQNPAGEMLLKLKNALNRTSISSKALQQRISLSFYGLQRRVADDDKNRLLCADLLKKIDKYSVAPESLRLSKKGNGINLFSSRCDQFEMRELLSDLVKAQLLDKTFKYPSAITKFRDPDLTHAPKTDAVWQKQIMAILKLLKIPTDDIDIGIRGYFIPPKDAVLSSFQKTFRVDMTAELIGLDYSYHQKLKSHIDGMEKMLGCEKTHVRAYYCQVIAFPSKKLFDAFEDQYNKLVLKFREDHPLMFFETMAIKMRNLTKIKIMARSSSKEDFIDPQRILSALYTPKFIKLQGHEFTFLDKMTEGQQILEDLEHEYRYKIYFGFQKYNKILKVYCQDSEFKQIQQKLKEKINQCKYYCEKISYRGKNLNKVLSVLNETQKNEEEGGFAYLVYFQTRQIEITSSMKAFEQAKNSLLGLENSAKGECQICADTLRNPFKFINCQCVFCWHCITEYFRQFYTSQSMTLCCPSQKCLPLKTSININDFKALLSEQEFQKICDLKVKKYIQQNQKKISCLICKVCENIVYKDDIDESGMVACNVCGTRLCPKCLQKHEGYTCSQWAVRNEIGKEQLQKLGIKQCPTCKMGIEKNHGCNHIQCKKCGSHICWKCLKVFRTSKECYDHLAKQEGGILDPNDL